MLSDDEMTRELGAAFRTEAASLMYTGRRQPPHARKPLVLSAAVAVTAVALAATASIAAEPGTHNAATAAPVTSPALVTSTIRLDGLVLHVQRRAGQPSPIQVRMSVRSVPAGARPVPLSTSTAHAWVGKDPASGDNALYIQAATRNGGKIFALVSSSLTADQLVAVLRDGSPSLRTGSPVRR